MDYKLDVSPDKTFILVRPLANFTNKMALDIGKKMSKMAHQLNIQNTLLDMRGIAQETSIAEKYEFAYNKSKKIGFRHDWKYAILVNGLDSNIKFLETVMFNAGYSCRIFEKKEDVIVWFNEEY